MKQRNGSIISPTSKKWGKSDVCSGCFASFSSIRCCRRPHSAFLLTVLCLAVTFPLFSLSSIKLQAQQLERNDGLLPDPNVVVKQLQNNTHGQAAVWLAGIIRNAASDIQPHILRYLTNLNCQHNISIYIVAATGVHECVDAYQQLRRQYYSSTNACAAFWVEKEPPHQHDNRIDRIAMIRDYQRRQLQHTKLQHTNEFFVMMVADLDLYSLPDPQVVLHELQSMQHNKTYPDVVCAAGVMYRPFGYYDIFATVLLPNTFVYPVRGRWNQTLYPDEDVSLVRSNDLYGNFTQWDLLDYFVHTSAQLQHTPVPVRSCFGGLTLYRARTWLEPKCNYHSVAANNNNITTPFLRYATKASQRPCEHVVFHECLRNHHPTTKIAVQPKLRTEWNANTVFGSKLYPGTRHESLGVFRNHADHADRLVHGKYSLQIHSSGVFVVKRANVTIWSNTAVHDEHMDYWTHSFLMLQPDGTLELVKQVSKSMMEKRHHYQSLCNKTITASASARSRCECDVKNDHCKVVVWTTRKNTHHGIDSKKMRNANETFVLILRENGRLEVVEETSKKVVWKNTAND